MSEFSESAIRAAGEAIYPDAFRPDAHPVATRDYTAIAKEALSAAVKTEMRERALASENGGTRITEDAIIAGARALAEKRGFTIPDDYQICAPGSKIGMAVSDARTCLEAVFFDDVITHDNVALRDAFAAAVYLIDRYRAALAGKPVRDLDEAEVAFHLRNSKIGLRSESDLEEINLPHP